MTRFDGLNMRRAEAPFAVQLPAPADDKPSWAKVGVIAAIGFVIGVAWPRLAGVRLGPNTQSEATPSTTAAPVRAADANLPPMASPSTASAAAPSAWASAGAASAAAPAAEALPPNVTVNRGVVLTCRTEDGESLKGASACGTIAFDGIAQPRLKKLAACPAAAGLTGKLSAVFNIDFKTNKVAVETGKSSTVPNLEGLAACLKTSFQGVSLGPLAHDQVRYAVLYGVTFKSPSPATAPNAAPTSTPMPPSAPPTLPPSVPAVIAEARTPDSPEVASDGTAQVVWEVAIVRDAPRTGQVVARLQRGTKMRLGAGQDGWYRVQYGAGFTSEGWVYRGAIGR